MQASGGCPRTAGHQMPLRPDCRRFLQGLKLQDRRSRTGGGCLQGREPVAPRRFVVAYANKRTPMELRRNNCSQHPSRGKRMEITATWLFRATSYPFSASACDGAQLRSGCAHCPPHAHCLHCSIVVPVPSSTSISCLLCVSRSRSDLASDRLGVISCPSATMAFRASMAFWTAQAPDCRHHEYLGASSRTRCTR
jgi:hypothetical protein